MSKQSADIIETKYGLYLDDIEHEGKIVSVFIDDDYWVLVDQAGEIVAKQYVPGAEIAYRDEVKRMR